MEYCTNTVMWYEHTYHRDYWIPFDKFLVHNSFYFFVLMDKWKRFTLLLRNQGSCFPYCTFCDCCRGSLSWYCSLSSVFEGHSCMLILLISITTHVSLLTLLEFLSRAVVYGLYCVVIIVWSQIFNSWFQFLITLSLLLHLCIRT